MRKVFTNLSYGAPSPIRHAVNTMVDVLSTCLVDGFGDQTPTSITRTGDVATMVLPNAHGLIRTGVMTISGATQGDYNGEFRVTVVDATTVTFDVLNTPVTPATGTITARFPGAGWTKPFTDTNKAVFKQGVTSNGFYLDIDDSVAGHAAARGYETMSAVGTGTGPFPTTAQQPTPWWIKGDTTTNSWVVVADEHFVMVWTPYTSNTFATAGSYYFGDIAKIGTSAYATLINCSSSASTPNNGVLTQIETLPSSYDKRWLARNYTDVGSSHPVALLGDSTLGNNSTQAGAGNLQYPNPVDNGLYMQEMRVAHHAGSDILHGNLDGVYDVLHDVAFGITEHSYFAGTGDFAGVEFMYLPGYSNASFVMRLTE